MPGYYTGNHKSHLYCKNKICRVYIGVYNLISVDSKEIIMSRY